MSVQGRLQAAALRAGWVLGRRLPRAATRPLAAVGARAAVAGFVDTSGWRANVARVAGTEPTDAMAAQAIQRYTRYFLEMLSLPSWTSAQIAATVSIDPAAFRALRDDVYGPGAVLALGHLGNWDLAGAWACRHGLPVTSVAEELPGSAYADFLRYRESLGMAIYGHRSRGLVERLVADAADHRLVCLLADRDLRGRGIPVRWPVAGGYAHTTVPAGPALVAQRSGASLRALALRYDGPRMVMNFSDRIVVAPGAAGLAAAMQAVVDHLGAAVAADPTQWHVLQPFFGQERR